MARVKFLAGVRSLGLSLAEIADLLSFRDKQKISDPDTLNFIQRKADEVAQRIADLHCLETELRQLHALSLSFPDNVIERKKCEHHRLPKA